MAQKPSWNGYLAYNHIKHFYRVEIVDRLNRHGFHALQFSDERIKTYAGRQVLSNADTNTRIGELLDAGKPMMVARLGGSEMNYLYYHLRAQEHGDPSGLDKAMHRICDLSGFFPQDTKMVDEMAKMYFEDMPYMDLCGVWRFFMEDYFLQRYAPDTELTVLERLEPWRCGILPGTEKPDPANTAKPWSAHLAGKKVLLVHPFADTIGRQYRDHRMEIFSKGYAADDILPEFKLMTLRSVQSLGGEGAPGYASWFEALDDMTDKMNAMDYDVVILGCGAYGLPLAARAKRAGKMAIHLGGATQLMFGIRGGRWDNTPEITRLMNESWTTANADETPKCADKIEEGCYW